MNTESKRQQRFANIIQKDLAELFQRDGNNWAPGAFITITKVRVTPDLSIARAYLSFLDSSTAQEKLDQIRQKTSEIRYKLGTKVRHDIKAVPLLEFYLDDTSEYTDHMDKIFDQINKSNESEE